MSKNVIKILMQIILRENNEEHAQNVQDDRFREAMRFKCIQMSTILFMKLHDTPTPTRLCSEEWGNINKT